MSNMLITVRQRAQEHGLRSSRCMLMNSVYAGPRRAVCRCILPAAWPAEATESQAGAGVTVRSGPQVRQWSRYVTRDRARHPAGGRRPSAGRLRALALDGRAGQVLEEGGTLAGPSALG